MFSSRSGQLESGSLGGNFGGGGNGSGFFGGSGEQLGGGGSGFSFNFGQADNDDNMSGSGNFLFLSGERGMLGCITTYNPESYPYP